MTPTVTLKISNPNNSTYPTIILRKFFNMVFAEPDGKTFNVYTATVFGGASEVKKPVVDDLKDMPIPKLDQENDCELEFRYQIDYDDSTVANSSDISVCDITEQFLSDDDTNEYHVKNRDEIRKVWGNIAVLENQIKVKELLLELYPSLYKKREDIHLPGMKNLGTVLHIKDDQDERQSHQCVVCKGNYYTNGISNGYRLAINGNAVAGIEAINWIKTTVRLKRNILKSKNLAERNIRFVVQFAGTDIYYTPDFTWYFAPPCNYVVDESATLTFSGKKPMPNKVAPVADGTTVRFKEWLDEGIGERKKSRVSYFSEYTAAKPYGFSKNSVEVLLSFTNPGKHGNFQFFIGLIVSYLLSFCSDMGRLSAYKDACTDAGLCSVDCVISGMFGHCICENLCHLLSILFPVIMVSAFCAISYRQEECIPEQNRTNDDKLAIIARWFGLVSTGLLVLYINVGWLIVPGLISAVVKKCIVNQMVVAILLLVSLFGNICYGAYCWKVKKRNLIDFF